MGTHLQSLKSNLQRSLNFQAIFHYNMSAIKVPTSHREEFKKYLEKTGIQEKLVHMLVTLYEEPEKPEDPLAYLKGLFNTKDVESADLETLKQENSDLKVKLGEAEEKVKELEAKLAELAPSEAEATQDAAAEEAK